MGHDSYSMEVELTTGILLSEMVSEIYQTLA